MFTCDAVFGGRVRYNVGGARKCGHRGRSHDVAVIAFLHGRQERAYHLQIHNSVKCYSIVKNIITVFFSRYVDMFRKKI